MEEKNNSPVKNPPLPAYKLAKLLYDCETEKKVLASQVEDLKVQLQTAKIQAENSTETTSKLAAKLQAQRTEMEHLNLQIKKHDKAPQNARGNPDSSQQRGDRKNHTVASGRCGNAKMFREPEGRLMKELIESRDQFKEFLETRAQLEQEKLQEIQTILSQIIILKDLKDLKVAYEVEKEKNLALQQELEQVQKHLRQEGRFHAEKALADLFLIRELRAVIEEQQNNVNEMRPLLSDGEYSEGQTLGQDTLELLEQSLKTSQEGSCLVFDSQVSRLLPVAGTLEKLPTKKKPSMKKTLHRFLGWKNSKKYLTKPDSSGDNNSSLNNKY